MTAREPWRTDDPSTRTLTGVPKSTGENWMGCPEVAEYLGVGLRTVYSFIDKGLIPAYKLGRVIRYAGADFRYPPRS